MIKIDKSNQIPEILTGDKASDAQSAIDNMIQQGRQPVSGDFDNTIYNGRGVKTQLLQDQNNKCAYCEITMEGDFGAVEHYRPKTGWRENDIDTLHTPGYYWLAYEWTNLLCSCDKCNSVARKGNLFPLRDPAMRDIEHKNISNEVPLIINPTLEDPGQFLQFKRYVAVAAVIDGEKSDKGRKTIDTFDLNGRIPVKNTPARTDLLDARRKRWSEAKALYDAYISQGMDRSEAINNVKAIYTQPAKPFSGMFVNQNMWF